jgi:ABC-type methionine transport system permease subunit
MLFNAVWEAFWILTGRSPVFETGTLVHTFMFFLFLMGLMIGLLAIAMHRYHTLAPPNLNQVIRNLQESHS